MNWRSSFLRDLLTATILFVSSAGATWNISFDLDGRASYSSREHGDINLHAAGLLIRKSLADSKGDRLTFTVLGEAHDTFKELMIHEAWVRYKGPMGKWNITAGRMGLPYGLLPSFPTTRLLFTTPYESITGFDVDNGIQLSGVLGDFDYGIALTQGLGPHQQLEFPGHGLVSGRAGLTTGDGGEYQFGVSLLAGKSAGMHHHKKIHHHYNLGIDGTTSLGLLTLRGSVDGGKKDEDYFITGFAWSEYALNRYLDLNLGLKAQKTLHHSIDATIYAGSTLNLKYFTMRGAYSYDYSNKDHRIGIQLYRLFSYVF